MSGYGVPYQNKIPKIGERVEIASRYIGKCGKLLDVGCGVGIIKHFLKGKPVEIYGIDKSNLALKRARRRGFITLTVDLDKEKIPFKSNYFDIVTCLDVIEHVVDPVVLAKEIFRVLKKGGKLILSSPNIRFSDHLSVLVFRGRFPTTGKEKSAYDGGHIHYFTFSDLKHILVKVGFKILKEEGILNRLQRGIRGRIGERILGKNFMREFRSPGILLIAQKKNESLVDTSR